MSHKCDDDKIWTRVLRCQLCPNHALVYNMDHSSKSDSLFESHIETKDPSDQLWTAP